jgi:hypothetical protein
MNSVAFLRPRSSPDKFAEEIFRLKQIDTPAAQALRERTMRNP